MVWMMGLAAMACSRPGYGKDVPAPQADVPTTQSTDAAKAVLAGGCFWCTEGVFQELDGVQSVVSGYAGGSADTANYEAVCTGRTGHAEAIEITYDPSKITYGKLLQVFFATHDPTTPNAQGPDHGTQYRSAIFFADADQKKVAEAYIKQLTDAGVFTRPIVTTLEPLTAFYPAEKYHQDYVDNNPFNPYIKAWALPKIDKVRKNFPGEVKPPTTRPTAY